VAAAGDTLVGAASANAKNALHAVDPNLTAFMGNVRLRKSVRNTAALFEVLVAVKMTPLLGLDSANA